MLQGRVVKPPPTEKSYHIFYQMLAGLKNDERTQLGLEGYSVKNLHYLNQGDTRVDQVLDAQRFAQWRSSLAVLGIPLMDVLRVLSAILLLGNVEFYNNDSFEVDLSNGREEMETVARLLGVSKTLLWQGITTRTHTVRGQPVKSVSDANSVTLFLLTSQCLKITKKKSFATLRVQVFKEIFFFNFGIFHQCLSY